MGNNYRHSADHAPFAQPAMVGSDRSGMVGGGIRRGVRHLRRLHSHNDWPAHAAPHGCLDIQLRAAHRLGLGEHRHRHRHLPVVASPRRHPRLHRRMAGNKVEIATGHGEGKGT